MHDLNRVKIGEFVSVKKIYTNLRLMTQKTIYNCLIEIIKIILKYQLLFNHIITVCIVSKKQVLNH